MASSKQMEDETTAHEPTDVNRGVVKEETVQEKGRDEFFKSRIQKYQSPEISGRRPPQRQELPGLFDMSKFEKKDIFIGTYMPSLELTGGYRILSYLDTSEPKHDKLKRVIFYLLKSSRDSVLPEFHLSFTELFETLETALIDKGKANFVAANDQAAFNFLARSLQFSSLYTSTSNNII
ncbi:hypothetical protein FF1_000092 [Malus domestica]